MRIIYPLSLKRIISEEIQIVTETYSSIKEIHNLANNIIKFIADRNLEQINKDKHFKYLYGVGLHELSSSTEYKELNSFINDVNLYISFEPKNDKEISGEYEVIIYNNKKHYNPNDERELNIYYDYSYIKEKIDNSLKEKINLSSGDLFNKIHNELYSPLIHELQHAYDDYRSKSIIYSNKKHKDYLKKYLNNLQTKLHDKEINYFEKHKEYLNLPHEIWARFSQTIETLIFIEMDFEGEGDNMKVVHNMKSIHDVIKEFKHKFVGYNVLPEKNRKKIINKVSQIWHYEKNTIDELNKKWNK